MSRTREPAIANTTADYPKLGLALIDGTDQSKSLIGVPIISSDRVLGIIVMEDYERENAYGECGGAPADDHRGLLGHGS